MPPSVRRPLILAVAGILALAASPGCRSGGRQGEGRTPPRIRAVESRIDVVLGRTLVMPVALEGGIHPGRPIAARLDDGRAMSVSLHWIGVSQATSRTSRWLPESGTWTTAKAAPQLKPAGAGTWAIVVDLPTDAIGQGLWLGRQRTPLNWLPSPDLLKGRDGPMDWSSPLGNLSQSPELERLAYAEAKSPARRWRHRLMFGGLVPKPNPNLTPGAIKEAAADTFEDPVLESLAEQIEGRWQVALATLWLADPKLATLVKRRLVNVVDFGGGNIAPAWPANVSDLDVLLSDLLNTRLRPRQQVERAEAWLETLPPAAAWVVDDGGQRDALTGQTVATIGAANLTGHDTLGWAQGGPDSPAPDMTPMPAWGVAQLVATGGTPPETRERHRRGTPPMAPVQVNVGKWSGARPAVLSPIPAMPPGVRLEPFRGEWDMATWLAGAAPAPLDDAWSAAGLVYFDGAADSWCIFVECRSPMIGSVETLRIWIGAFAAPSAVIRVNSAGPVTDEFAPRLGVEKNIRGAAVTRQGDIWTARVPIPARCFESDGTLRIGVERTDAHGRRTSWPRPMLPWQTEPGRIAIETAAWSRLRGLGSRPSP